MGAQNIAYKKIGNPQMRCIYALARELGMDNDLLHEMVYSMTKKEHIKELTSYEAASVIDSLKAHMKGTGRLKKAEAQREGMASRAQISKIYALMYELKKYDKPGSKTAKVEKRLRGVLKKFNKVDDVRFLSASEAWKVIEEIKKLIANEERKAKKILKLQEEIDNLAEQLLDASPGEWIEINSRIKELERQMQVLEVKYETRDI